MACSVEIDRDIEQVDTIPDEKAFEASVSNKEKRSPRCLSKWIRVNEEGKSVFNFMSVTPDVLYKKLSVLNGKKATGVKMIKSLPRLVKTGAAQLSEVMAILFHLRKLFSMLANKSLPLLLLLLLRKWTPQRRVITDRSAFCLVSRRSLKAY